MAKAEKDSKFGFDPATGKLMLGQWRLSLPKSRPARVAIGSGLIICGILGFLPVLGFWMVPLGIVVLSQDIPAARRMRRRFSVWWARRKNSSSSSNGEGRS